ncbi:MAG: hypothetical protein V4481_01725 [Patescibacteria group bacterium]
MKKEELEKLVQEAKQKYKSIGSAPCPALNNEQISFNKHGLRHLLFKRGLPRPQSEQLRRLMLVQHAPYILKSGKLLEYRENIESATIGRFWAITGHNQDTKITVIVRQIGNGKKHFFSPLD